MENWIECVKNLGKFQSYTRYREGVRKEARQFFLEMKPKHLKEKETEPYI